MLLLLPFFVLLDDLALVVTFLFTFPEFVGRAKEVDGVGRVS
jgi:hypothetical protein